MRILYSSYKENEPLRRGGRPTNSEEESRCGGVHGGRRRRAVNGDPSTRVLSSEFSCKDDTLRLINGN